jgi:hypothetical protein
MITLPLN